MISSIETIAEFYERRHVSAPGNIHQEIGHFNVFKLDPYVGENAKPVPYSRRDYFKITLLIGQSKIEYADKVIDLKNQALVFSNPHIPYKWEHTQDIQHGFFCVFDQAFFHQYGNLNQYSIFQPEGNHVFELCDEQVDMLNGMFERMFSEIDSDYQHKYDVLRTIIFEIVHFALKMQPTTHFTKNSNSASQRISMLFLELLDRQFPIDSAYQRIPLRSASDFAQHLNIHVNHLNRVVKEVTQKTTTQIIAERIFQESKVLLKHTSWSVSEIAYSLGFTEVTHFNNFFKKFLPISPVRFRNV